MTKENLAKEKCEKKKKKKASNILSSLYLLFQRRTKNSIYCFKKKKTKKPTTRTKNNNHSIGVRPWHSVQSVTGCSYTTCENHCHGELSPASPCLVLLSTTSQTAKSALPLSSVCQLEELSSLLVPSFLNCSICTAISSLHPGS